jgi:hypothetical protein
MFANLVAYNNRSIGKISEASVEFTGDPDDVIQLTIGLKKYCFNSDGKLVIEGEIQTTYSVNNHMSCSQSLQQISCSPTISKTED